MNSIIENHKKEIFSLCQKHRVKSLYIFGSVLGDKFNESSDIDMIVYFENELKGVDYGQNYFQFKFGVSDLFNKSLDLIKGKQLKNKYFIQEIEKTQVLFYNQR